MVRVMGYEQNAEGEEIEELSSESDDDWDNT